MPEYIAGVHGVQRDLCRIYRAMARLEIQDKVVGLRIVAERGYGAHGKVWRPSLMDGLGKWSPEDLIRGAYNGHTKCGGVVRSMNWDV